MKSASFLVVSGVVFGVLGVSVLACDDDNNSFHQLPSSTQEGLNCSVSYGGGCDCKMYGTPNSYTCQQDSTNGLCCARSGWPSDKYSGCSCKPIIAKCEVSSAYTSGQTQCTCTASTSSYTSSSSTGATNCYPGGKTTPSTDSDSTANCCLSATSCTCHPYKVDCGSDQEVSSCSLDSIKPECSSSETEVTSCSGGFASSSSGGSSSGSTSSSSGSTSSSSSSGSDECDGCHANSDCGTCERCVLSTCTCVAKAVCN